MKTKSFLLGAAALMLATACTNDEVVNVAPQSGAIGFSSFVDNATRADYNLGNLEGFNVWGVLNRTAENGGDITETLVFNAQEVNKEGTAWTYSPTQYWIDKANYKFAAVAPKAAAGVSDQTMTMTDGLTFTFNNATAKADVDLLFADAAKTEVDPASVGKVELSFIHMLSRVKFNFKNDFESENIAIVVNNVKVTNAASEASFSGSAENIVWTRADGDANYTIDFKTKGVEVAGKDAEMTPHMYFIPVATPIAYVVTFDVDYKIKDLSTGTWNLVKNYAHTVTIPTETLSLENNKSYTLTASINEKTIDPDPETIQQPIVFDVTEVKDMTEVNAGNLPGFNK